MLLGLIESQRGADSAAASALEKAEKRMIIGEANSKRGRSDSAVEEH